MQLVALNPTSHQMNGRTIEFLWRLAVPSVAKPWYSKLRLIHSVLHNACYRTGKVRCQSLRKMQGLHKEQLGDTPHVPVKHPVTPLCHQMFRILLGSHFSQFSRGCLGNPLAKLMTHIALAETPLVSKSQMGLEHGGLDPSEGCKRSRGFTKCFAELLVLEKQIEWLLPF